MSKSRRSPPNAGSLLVASSAALLSVLVGVAFDVFRNAVSKPPRSGRPISGIHYHVDVESLRSSRERWTSTSGGDGDVDVPESVHVAAEKLAVAFSKSASDDSLRTFLEGSAQASSSARGRAVAYAKEAAYHSLQRYLGWSRTDASGFVRRATLYVASEDQFRQLLGAASAGGDEMGVPIDDGGGAKKPPMLLDVGSGTGSETAKLASALGVDAEQVVCIETSTSMQKKLKDRGFRVASSFAEIASNDGADADDEASRRPLFSSAALLNVLDRCDDPGQLLDAATDAIEPGGQLALAIVLPFGGTVFEGRFWHPWGKAASRRPRRPMAIRAVANAPKSFEAGAATFLEAILRLRPDLELVRWTRLPYVSSGNHKRTHFIIDMALLTLRKRKGPSSERPAESGAAAAASRAVGGREMPTQCQKRSGDEIFSWLATTLASNGREASWGDVLDAGAGLNSVCWLMHQKNHDTLTVVTARPEGADSYGDVLKSIAGDDPDVEIALGNWREEDFMKDRGFDVVVSDYLLGATELHWKYGAESLLERLLNALKPGGFLCVVGLEPYETILDRTNARDRLVLDVEAIGDSAAILAGRSTYRELPEEWVRRQVERRPDFRVVAARRFPMRLTAKSLRRQIAYASEMAAKIEDQDLRVAYVKRIKDLELEVERFEVHNRARNYAIVLQRGSGHS